MECYIVMENEEIVPFVAMGGPQVYYAEWKHVKLRKTNTLWFHLYVEAKIENKETNKKQTHKRIDGCQGQGGGTMGKKGEEDWKILASS